MSNNEDSWMNPETSVSFQGPRDYTKTPWTIERERRIQGPITQWDVWSYHASKPERDAAMCQLIAEHPAWHLRDGYWQPLRAYL